jgi:K+-sensing histidine kinase KdpD
MCTFPYGPLRLIALSILNLIQKEYKTLENKLLPINLTLYVDARNKVKETKGKNLEKALTEVLKENKISTIIKGITSIATLLAYKNFIDDLINKIPNEENIIILESKPDEKKIKKVILIYLYLELDESVLENS